MELLRIWRIILGHRVMIIVMTLFATVSGVLLTYCLPQKYEATAIVLVRPKEEIQLGASRSSKEVWDFPLSQIAPLEAPSKTYMEVIKSQSVAEKIVLALNLHNPPPKIYNSKWEEFKDYWKSEISELIRSAQHIFKYGEIIPASSFERAVEDVMKGFSLEVIKDTYIFHITFTASEPEIAAAVANMAAEIFLEHSEEGEKKESRTNRIFLQNRLNETKEFLVETREALKSFKEKNHTFAIVDEYREKLKVLRELEKDYEDIQVKIAGLLKKYNPTHSAVASALAERNYLEQSLSEYKKALKSNPEKEKRLEALAFTLAVAEENYQNIFKKYEEARIKESESLRDIRLSSPAVAPNYPSRPIKYYFGGGAFVLALITGVALAFLKESNVSRIRSVDDAQETLQLRVLATVPVIKKSKF